MAYTHEIVLNIASDRPDTVSAMAKKWEGKDRNPDLHAELTIDVTNEGWCKRLDDSPLAVLPHTARLYIVGHCQPGDARIYTSIKATHGIYWYELAQFLALNLNAESVKSADAGPHLMISLISCHAGRGWQEGDDDDKPYVEKSFALQLHAALGYYGIYARVHARTLTTTVWTETGSKFTGAKGKGLSEENKQALAEHIGYCLLGSKVLIHWTDAKKQRYSNKEIDAAYLEKGLKVVDTFTEYKDDVKASLLLAQHILKDVAALWVDFDKATDVEKMDQFVSDVERKKGVLFKAEEEEEIGELLAELMGAKAKAVKKATRPTLRVFPVEDTTTLFSFGSKPPGML